MQLRLSRQMQLRCIRPTQKKALRSINPQAFPHGRTLEFLIVTEYTDNLIDDNLALSDDYQS